MAGDIKDLLRSHDELRATVRVAGRLIKHMRRINNVDPVPTLQLMHRSLMDGRAVVESFKLNAKTAEKRTQASVIRA